MLIHLPDGHSAPKVADVLITIFVTLPPGLRRTLTWDQGNEMFHHARIETATELKVYFAAPRAPWQRATTENTNGLLHGKTTAELVQRWERQPTIR